MPRFWTLVSLFLLYILGAALVLRHLFLIASRDNDTASEVVVVMEFINEVLNAFTKLALVGVLNYVQVGNVARSRFKYLLREH